MALEESLECTIDESRFAAATTVADLEELIRPLEGQGAATVHLQPEAIDFPTWNRSIPIRALRRASLPTWILPLARVFVKLEVRGLEHLQGMHGAGDLRRQSSKPPRHAGNPLGAAGTMALSRCTSHGEGIFQGALLSRSSSADSRGSPTASITIWRRRSSTRFRCHSAKRERGRRCVISAISSRRDFHFSSFPKEREPTKGRSTGSSPASE